jgi:tetratricopeptide (TPR) repeat protein
MSSRAKAEPSPPEDLGLELALLCDALDMAERGAFLFAVCEEGPLRERLMQQVYDHLQAEDGNPLIAVELSPEQSDLAGQLEQQLLYEGSPEKERAAAPAAVHDRPHSPVVFVHTHGLAEPRDEAAVRTLRALNFQRERLSRLKVPLVFWLSQNTLGQVVQHAADLFAARSSIFYFETPLHEPGAPPPMRAEAMTSLLDRFHRTLLPPEEPRKRAVLYERRLIREQATDGPNWPRIAFLCRDLAHIHRELDDYARAGEFQDQAITAYEEAIAAQEAEGEGPEWANLYVWLGLAHADRIRGDRAENLEQAIDHYQRALEIYTRQDFPEDWAMTQNNLGIAYRNRIQGDRAENLEQAIGHYQRALEVRTRQDFPADWAMTHNNLGAAYANRIRGDRAENLEQAIGHCQRALEVYTHHGFPADWAMTQHNLGTAYADRIRGKRAENLEQAIHHLEQSLEIYTRQAFPVDWAMAQGNLGLIYTDRIRGERAENVEQAIAHTQAALKVFSREAFPQDWAQAQNNLGNAYTNRIRGDRAENLQQAIACLNNALTVWTAEAFPHYHAMAARNLERALSQSKPPSLRERVQAALRRFRLRKSERLPKSRP